VENRPVPLYTRTGDAGETALFDGSRVSKADPRVDAYGEVDELGAWLGVVRSQLADHQPHLTEQLVHVQRDLFAVGALLADPRHRIAARVVKAGIGDADISRLEGWIDAAAAETRPLRRFILAGGSPAAASLHLARTVCRRAERRAVSLGADQVDALVIIYLNRLSDLLFAMARAVNARTGTPEIEW
jgi:cob(I)alamin adenosyltransferase